MTAIKEIIEELDLEYWAEREGISCKRVHGHSGEQLNFKTCPACGNSNKKVYLNAETGLGNCFVCGETFNKATFINKTLGLNWRETFSNMTDTLKEQGWRPKRETAVAVENTDQIKLPLSFALPTDDGQNLVYLEKRGVTGEVAKYFHLRYCSDGWWNFTKADGSKSGQKFDERVIIPVYDLDGELKTFQGRDVTGTAEKRYLFPMGLPGTGAFLYNGQNALATKRIVMCEGVFDVIAAKNHLDTEPILRDVVPVGSFGKHLSYGRLDGDDQLGRLIKLKARGVSQVTMMWDGEVKALTAAITAGEIIKRIGIEVRIGLLPKDKDPNEVPASVFNAAYNDAQVLTPQLAVKWRLRNPYA